MPKSVCIQYGVSISTLKHFTALLMEKSSILVKILIDPKTILNHPYGPKTKIECLWADQIALVLLRRVAYGRIFISPLSVNVETSLRCLWIRLDMLDIFYDHYRGLGAV